MPKQQQITDTDKDLGLAMVNLSWLVFHGSFYILNAPWDEHSMMLFKSVPELCFIGLFAVLDKATIDHSAPLEKWHLERSALPGPLTLTSKQFERQQNVMSKHIFSQYDLDIWPTTLTYNPNLAKVKVNPHAKNQGRRSNGSSRRVQTDKRINGQTNKQTLPNVLSPLLRGR